MTGCWPAPVRGRQYRGPCSKGSTSGCSTPCIRGRWSTTPAGRIRRWTAGRSTWAPTTMCWSSRAPAATPSTTRSPAWRACTQSMPIRASRHSLNSSSPASAGWSSRISLVCSATDITRTQSGSTAARCGRTFRRLRAISGTSASAGSPTSGVAGASTTTGCPAWWRADSGTTSRCGRPCAAAWRNCSKRARSPSSAASTTRRCIRICGGGD